MGCISKCNLSSWGQDVFHSYLIHILRLGYLEFVFNWAKKGMENPEGSTSPKPLFLFTVERFSLGSMWNVLKFRGVHMVKHKSNSDLHKLPLKIEICS